MRNLVWTAVLAVLLGVGAVVVSIAYSDYPAIALCLAALSITMSVLSIRER